MSDNNGPRLCKNATQALDLSAFSKIDRIQRPTTPDLNAGKGSSTPEKVMHQRFHTASADI